MDEDFQNYKILNVLIFSEYSARFICGIHIFLRNVLRKKIPRKWRKLHSLTYFTKSIFIGTCCCKHSISFLVGLMKRNPEVVMKRYPCGVNTLTISDDLTAVTMRPIFSSVCFDMNCRFFNLSATYFVLFKF